MKIGKNEIATPYDDEPYNLSWRSEAAVSLLNEPSAAPPEIADDSYVQRYTEYLRGRQRLNGKMPPGFGLEHVATKWALREKGTPLKLYVDPLLLTTAPFEIINQGLSSDVDLLRCYERLFFAVRADDGTMLLDKRQRRRVAYAVKTPESLEEFRALKWRVAAAVGDYNTLTVLIPLWNLYWEDGPPFTLDQFDEEGDLGEEIKNDISIGLIQWKGLADLGGPPMPVALQEIGYQRRSKKHKKRIRKYAHLWK